MNNKTKQKGRERDDLRPPSLRSFPGHITTRPRDDNYVAVARGVALVSGEQPAISAPFLPCRPADRGGHRVRVRVVAALRVCVV